MIAPIQQVPTSPSNWHETFLEMLPDIRRQTYAAFPLVPGANKDELVSEVIANVFCAFARLVERQKHLHQPGVLIGYAIRHVRWGRRTGARQTSRDVSSAYAQRLRGIRLESLDCFAPERGGWQEVLVEDRKAGPAETAVARIDFRAWLGSLSPKHRRIAVTLSSGESTKSVACSLGISPGRVSQVRQELRRSWELFQGTANEQCSTTRQCPRVARQAVLHS